MLECAAVMRRGERGEVRACVRRGSSQSVKCFFFYVAFVSQQQLAARVSVTHTPPPFFFFYCPQSQRVQVDLDKQHTDTLSETYADCKRADKREHVAAVGAVGCLQ